MRLRPRSLILALTLLVVSATAVFGQSTGSIVGTVTDPQGGVVSDATVVARQVDTGIERTTKTTSDGLFRFDSLPPAVYNIRVEASGFAKAEVNGVKLQVGEQRDVNLKLAVTGATITVDVTAAAPLVETSKTDVSSVIDEKTVATLPTTTSFNGIGGAANDYAGLAAIAPGVRYDFTGNSSDLMGPGAVNDRGIQVNIDGGNISDQVVSARDSLGASVEEVKEFQVLTNNYNAEYGQAGSIILNVITKSGTNQFHGDGHYYTRGRNLTASTFFYNLSDASQFRRAPFHKYEGGFTAGGPFIKDRTFWFVSYEQVRQAVPLQLVPPTGSLALTQPTKEMIWSAKIDHQLTQNNRIAARFNLQRDLTDNLQVQVPATASPASLVSSVVHDNTQNFSITSTPTVHTVNEGRFFWHHLLSATPTKTDLPGEIGPNFYFGAAFCCPQGAIQDRYQWVDNFSWTHGAHTVKTGANISYFPYYSLFTQFHFGEYAGFKAFPNIGSPTSLTIGIGPAQVNTGDTIYGFYVQDTWKIKSNLTLNYGLRYDVEVGAFKGGTGPAVAGSSCSQGNGIIPACSSDHNNFQPRVGISWSPHFEKGFLHTIFGDPDRSVIRASFAEVTELAYLNVSLDSLNFDGVNLFTTTFTQPAVLAFFPNRPPDSLLSSLRAPNTFGRIRPIAPNLKNPETRHYNLTIERQIGKSLVVDVGYLGVMGYGLFGERDTNFPTVNPDPAHPGFFYLGDRPDPRFTAIRTNENSRTSAYHGLLISAKKQLTHHFQFQAGYVWSKQLATSEDFFGISEPGDPRNIRADRALAQSNIPHQVNFGAVFDTSGVSKMRGLRHLVNEWTIGVLGTLQSGRPYPVSTGDAPFANAFFPGIGAETQQRPNVLPDGTLIATNIANGGANTNLLVGPNGHAMCHCPQTTFLAPAAASGLGPVDVFSGDIVDFQFVNGNLVRDAGVSDAYYRFDVSFIKAFKLGETKKIEFKADVFNIFNRPLFFLFNGLDTLNNMPLSTDPNCRVCLNAFTGKYIGSNGQPLRIQDLRHGRVSKDIQSPVFGGLGDPTGTDLARTVQLSVRFRW